MTPPYFINPAIDALPGATRAERASLVRLIAANVGDEATLRTLLGIDPEEFSHFYPDMQPPELTTDDTITAFIDRFSSESAAHTPEIDEIVCAPVVDYATLVDMEPEDRDTDGTDADPEEADDATSDAITAFLSAVPPKTPGSSRKTRVTGETEKTSAVAQEKETTPARNDENGGDLSEALFKLMVKKKNYRKALEIITELSLKNPKKSIYFAYQIRFLEKLIKNQEKGGQ